MSTCALNNSICLPMFPLSRSEMLFDSRGGTCVDFETILAMGWTPACAHLDLLLSNSEDGQLKACII